MKPTKEAHKFICKEAKEFITNNWDDINLEKVEIESKNKLLKEIDKDVYVALWVFTEVANWAMKDGKKIDFYVDTPEETDFLVLKIKDKYIKFKIQFLPKYKLEYVEFTEPKTKMVEVKYFE